MYLNDVLQKINCRKETYYKSMEEICNISSDNNTMYGYVAGIIDGEGSIEIHKNRSGFVPRITVTNTNDKLILYVKSILKFGSIIRRKNGINRKDVYVLIISNPKEILEVLKIIYPYLKIKQDRAIIMLYFVTEKLIHHKLILCRDTQSEYNLYSQMRVLNHRGK